MRQTLNDLILEKGILGIKIFNELYVEKYAMEYNDFIFIDNDDLDSLLHFDHTKESIEFLIMKGCDINYVNAYGLSPIYYQSRGESIKCLIDNGIDLTIQTLPHITHYFGNKDIDAIKYLIQYIDNESIFDFTITPYIAKWYDINSYLNPLLIKCGIDIYKNYPCSKQIKLLYETPDIFDNEPVLLNTDFNSDDLYLSGLCFVKDVRILDYICNHDKYKDNIFNLINYKNKYNENILFHITNPIIFEYILRLGCNPNAINIVGYNLLQYHDNLKIIKLLLWYGCNIDWCNPMLKDVYNKYFVSVCEYHYLMKRYKIYNYLNRYKHCIKIQRLWRRYIYNRRISEEHKRIKYKIHHELIYMPPVNKCFPGGIEYQNTLFNFNKLIILEE